MTELHIRYKLFYYWSVYGVSYSSFASYVLVCGQNYLESKPYKLLKLIYYYEMESLK